MSGYNGHNKREHHKADLKSVTQKTAVPAEARKQKEDIHNCQQIEKSQQCQEAPQTPGEIGLVGRDEKCAEGYRDKYKLKRQPTPQSVTAIAEETREKALGLVAGRLSRWRCRKLIELLAQICRKAPYQRRYRSRRRSERIGDAGKFGHYTVGSKTCPDNGHIIIEPVRKSLLSLGLGVPVEIQAPDSETKQNQQKEHRIAENTDPHPWIRE